MKIKEGYILRKVNNDYIVVTVGKAAVDFSGLIKLNETGAFLFDLLKDDQTKNSLLEAVINEYDVDEELALKDIDNFLNVLRKHNILNETN